MSSLRGLVETMVTGNAAQPGPQLSAIQTALPDAGVVSWIYSLTELDRITAPPRSRIACVRARCRRSWDNALR
jgi:hypothetical protein